MNIALLGPPGAGKGTQAQRICHAFNLVHLSSGDVLRAEKMAGTPLGLRIRDFIDKGMLVPDELMIQLMFEKILALPGGFVLDGFPRTVPQARALTEQLQDASRPLGLVLNFVVNPKVLAHRFEGRRICPVCLSVYHVDSMPPKVAGICDNDGHELLIREDDRPEVVRHRIELYQTSTGPLIAYYAQLGILKTIDAGGGVDDVTVVALDKIRRHFAAS